MEPPETSEVGRDGSGVMFDFDNYYFHIIDELPETDRPTTSEVAEVKLSRIFGDQATFGLLNTYYFQVRGAIMLFGRWNDERLLIEARDKARESCLEIAAILTVLHLKRGRPVVPPWVGIARDRLLPMIRESFPAAEHVGIEVDQVPRVQCRAAADRSIRVSALTREVYLHFNITLWTLIQEMFVEGLENLPSEEFMLRMLLPYMIQMNDYVPVSRLPQGLARSQETVVTAHRTTHLQMLFLLAHEYGHLLHHNLEQLSFGQTSINREFEADRFAFIQIGRCLPADDSDLFLQA